jgi:serine/threonine-protein kinase
LVKTDHASPEETNVSATGFIVGTPAFIAPETITGEIVDSRADIYSLGCVAYWLLTGQPVFACESRREMLYSHLNVAPVPPSRRTENPIPQSLETIVMSCLVKDLQSRCQTASDLMMKLESSGVGFTWTNARAKEWWLLHLPGQYST